METEKSTQQASDQLYRYATHLLTEQDKTPTQVKKTLIAQGVDEQLAADIVKTIEGQVEQSRKTRAKRDMIFGGLWCVGGTVFTFADIGYIFWGAIVFGLIQFIRGVSNLS